MKVIIIDDNELDQLVLEKLVRQNASLELKGVYSNAIEGASGIRSVHPDLILLDVEMPGMTGVEFINAITDTPQIIMVTSHEKYALDAFENDVTDFLVKPPSADRFNKAIDKARQMHDWISIKSEDDSHIFIREDREDVKLLLRDTLFLEAMSDYVKIQTTSKRHLVLSTMKAISTKLPADQFVRTHRSFIVNSNHIDSFDGTNLTIRNHLIPVSRNSKAKIKQVLANL